MVNRNPVGDHAEESYPDRSEKDDHDRRGGQGRHEDLNQEPGAAFSGPQRAGEGSPGVHQRKSQTAQGSFPSRAEGSGRVPEPRGGDS